MSSFCTSARITVASSFTCLQQHRLIAQRNARVGQPAERVAHFRGQLARMIRVNADEQRMIFPQHRAQFRRDALRQENRDARCRCAGTRRAGSRATARSKCSSLSSLNNSGSPPLSSTSRICGVLPDVLDLRVEFRMKIVAGGVADQPRARAIAAVTRATVRHQKQHAVGVTMHQARHGRMGVLTARVAHLPRRRVASLRCAG